MRCGGRCDAGNGQLVRKQLRVEAHGKQLRVEAHGKQLQAEEERRMRAQASAQLLAMPGDAMPRARTVESQRHS